MSDLVYFVGLWGPDPTGGERERRRERLLQDVEHLCGLCEMLWQLYRFIMESYSSRTFISCMCFQFVVCISLMRLQSLVSHVSTDPQCINTRSVLTLFWLVLSLYLYLYTSLFLACLLQLNLLILTQSIGWGWQLDSNSLKGLKLCSSSGRSNYHFLGEFMPSYDIT